MVFAQKVIRSSFLGLRCAYSTGNPTIAPSPALLLRVRDDLKVAMKAKDSSVLDVLRGLISEVTNAAKTSKPVTTDSQMLGVIRKRVKSSEAAAREFEAAQRGDLKEREVAQIAVLNRYLQNDTSMTEQDITTAIQDAIGKMRTKGNEVNRGSVIKALLGPGGSLESQPVDKGEVARLVGGMI